MNIYEIDERMLALDEAILNIVDEETGEITDEVMYGLLTDEMKNLEIERNRKIENMCYIRRIHLDNAEIAEKAERRAKAAKERERRQAERMGDCISAYLGGKKFKSPMVSVYYGKSEKVDILNEKALPDDYVELEINPKKSEIKKAIKSGEDVPGAKLEESSYTVIRYPSEKKESEG